jgi:hypothetical protein
MAEKMNASSSLRYDLKGKGVMLSASMPTELLGTFRAQDLYTAIVLFTHQIAASGGKIVFGGHPRITPLVHEAIAKLGKKKVVHLFQLERFKNQAPQEIHDADVFDDITWIGNGTAPMDEELGLMRDAMASASEAAVFIGGKTKDSLTKEPGIRDEYNRFLTKHPDGPVYLVGYMDGETLNLINELENKNKKEKNRLSDQELQVIHHSKSIDLVVSLILEDLGKKKKIGSRML